MSESGSESGDREILRDLEEDEERGERRRRDHKRETEEEGAAKPSSPVAADVERTECCAACLSKNRNNGRSCICQVPARQRRAPLGTYQAWFVFESANTCLGVDGCVTCKCTGCHPEDILAARG